MMMQDEQREQLRNARESHCQDEQLVKWQAEVDARQEQIDHLMRMVPTLRIRYAGKLFPLACQVFVHKKLDSHHSQVHALNLCVCVCVCGGKVH